VIVRRVLVINVKKTQIFQLSDFRRQVRYVNSCSWFKHCVM